MSVSCVEVVGWFIKINEWVHDGHLNANIGGILIEKWIWNACQAAACRVDFSQLRRWAALKVEFEIAEVFSIAIIRPMQFQFCVWVKGAILVFNLKIDASLVEKVWGRLCRTLFECELTSVSGQCSMVAICLILDKLSIEPAKPRVDDRLRWRCSCGWWAALRLRVGAKHLDWDLDFWLNPDCNGKFTIPQIMSII